MTHLLITCEHAVNSIPRKYASILGIPGEVLKSHRGYDIGALKLARFLSESLHCVLICGQTGRLLVDLNRSPNGRNLFSEYSIRLTPAQKKDILENHYLPYRKQVEHFVAEKVRLHKKIFHLSLHSFTPELNGKPRTADIGLLFDPERSREAAACTEIKAELEKTLAGFTIKKNYPYKGVSDGMCTFLRKKFTPLDYTGIELEINQKIFNEPGKYRLLKTHLPDVLKNITC